MKKLLKLLSVVLCIICCFSAAACDSNGGIIDDGSGYLKGSITIRIIKKGYGTQWLKTIAQSYEDNFPGCSVEIKENNDRQSAAAIAKSSANEFDLIVAVDNQFSLQYENYLVDLTDIYDSVQEGYDVPLKERMNQSLRNIFQDDGNRFYQMPWAEGYNGFIYNKTVLDSLFGIGKYSLPRTTDEFTEFCDRIWKESNFTVYPISMSASDAYWQTVTETFYQQYGGKEEHDNFIFGYYPEQTERGVVYKKVESRADFDKMLAPMSRKKSFEPLDVWLKSVKDGGYAHEDAGYMNFQEAQNAFLGNGYGNNTKKTAIMLNGDWLAKEMNVTDQTDIRFMKMPVLSSIVETLESPNINEERLRTVISAVDIDAEYHSSVGISEKDYLRIKQARFTATGSGENHVMFVPKLKKGVVKYPLAKQFLKYIVGDEAQGLYTVEQKGLAMPYHFDTTDFQVSQFAKSVMEAKGKDFTMVNRAHSRLIGSGGLETVCGYYEGQVFGQSEIGNAQSFIEYVDARNRTRYDNIVKYIQ